MEYEKKILADLTEQTCIGKDQFRTRKMIKADWHTEAILGEKGIVSMMQFLTHLTGILMLILNRKGYQMGLSLANCSGNLQEFLTVGRVFPFQFGYQNVDRCFVVV